MIQVPWCTCKDGWQKHASVTEFNHIFFVLFDQNGDLARHIIYYHIMYLSTVLNIIFCPLAFEVNVENIMESAWLWQCNIYTRGDTNVAALNKSSISLGKYFSGDLACSYGKLYRPETWHDCLHVYLWLVYQILFFLLIGWSFFMLQQWKPAIQCAQVLICENMIASNLHLVTGSWS